MNFKICQACTHIFFRSGHLLFLCLSLRVTVKEKQVEHEFQNLPKSIQRTSYNDLNQACKPGRNGPGALTIKSVATNNRNQELKQQSEKQRKVL